MSAPAAPLTPSQLVEYSVPAHRAIACTHAVLTGLYIGYKCLTRAVFQPSVLPGAKEPETAISGQNFQLGALFSWGICLPLVYIVLVQFFGLIINARKDGARNKGGPIRAVSGAVGQLGQGGFTRNWWWGGFLAAVMVLWGSLLALLLNVYNGSTLLLAIVGGAGAKSLESRYWRYLNTTSAFLVVFVVLSVYHLRYYIAINSVGGGALKGTDTLLPYDELNDEELVDEEATGRTRRRRRERA